MGLVKGGALRLLQTALYLLAFCCSAIILGIYSYFLAVLADRKYFIANKWRAVEGLSGAAVLYTIFATILTCCLAGITFFSFLGLFLDVLFVGAFIALAILTRDGTETCTGNVSTPLGYGPSNLGFGFHENVGSSDHDITYGVKLGTACRLNKACFAVAVIGAFIFAITALMQIALSRHHKKEKRYGPGPSNNYTSGYGKRSLFSRKKHAEKDAEYGAAGAAVGAGGLGVAAADTRPSHETGYTGSTVGGIMHEDKLNAPAPLPTHGGYHTQPQGTGVNPYSNTVGTATNY